MTSFGSVFKVIFKDKLKILWLFEVIMTLGLLATFLFFKIPMVAEGTSVITEAMVFILASIILGCGLFGFALLQEGIWNKNQYRMIPISEEKLVLANNLSTVVAVSLYYVIEILILLPFFNFVNLEQILNNFNLSQFFTNFGFSGLQFNLDVGSSALLILLIMTTVIMVLISMCNILLKAWEKGASNLNENLSIIIICLLASLIIGFSTKLGSLIYNGNLSLMWFFFISFCSSLIMMYISKTILKKHVETKK